MRQDLTLRQQTALNAQLDRLGRKRGPGGFPAPACELCDSTWLWYWCDVANWLWQNDMIKEDAFREAEEVEAINSVLEVEWQKRKHRELTEEVIKAVSSTSL